MQRQASSLERHLRCWLATLSLELGLATSAHAQSTATWEPNNPNWNSGGNWNPSGPPSGTAIFPAVTINTVNFPSAATTIGTLEFQAPDYSVNIVSGNSTLNIIGQGIVSSAANRPTVNIAQSGDAVFFLGTSSGGLARFVIGPGGLLDTSLRTTTTGMTAGSVDNGGLINLANPDRVTVGNQLTVFGPYFGRGGTIALNTFLGSDNSPSDKLVINGSTATIDGPATATGSSFLRITNAGGPGAQTTANGILVVDAINGGTTAPGAFTLANELRAGAFDYRLFRGGLDGISAPNDWFLRSTFIVPPVTPVPPIGTVPPVTPVPPIGTVPVRPFPPIGIVPGRPFPPIGIVPVTPIPPIGTLPPVTPVPPIGTVPPPTPGLVLPPDPPPSVLPPGLYPIIGPELATYGAVQPMARQIGLATLGTLNQRIGDTMTALNAGSDPNGFGRSDWARFFGQQINGHYQAFADPRTDGWLAGFQGGVDLWRGSTAPGHRDAAGVYFAYTEASADVTGLVTNAAATGYTLTRTGTNDIKAYTAGGYWTHYGPTGWYLDAVLQGTLYRTISTAGATQLSPSGSGFAASLETGYPIPLPLGPGFVLEPQAQIIWQHVKFDDANDGLGPVALGTTSGPIGRLGLRGQWNIASSNGMLWQPYAGVNYWRGWGAEATTTFGFDQVKLLENMQTVEAFVGFTGKLDKGFSVYAQAGYQFEVGSTTNAGPQGAKGTAGFRYSW